MPLTTFSLCVLGTNTIACFFADGCIDVNSIVRLSFPHASLTKNGFTLGSKIKENLSASDPIVQEKKIGPKEFTLGFNSKV